MCEATSFRKWVFSLLISCLILSWCRRVLSRPRHGKSGSDPRFSSHIGTLFRQTAPSPSRPSRPPLFAQVIAEQRPPSASAAGSGQAYDSAVSAGSLGLQVVEGLAVLAAVPAILTARKFRFFFVLSCPRGIHIMACFSRGRQHVLLFAFLLLFAKHLSRGGGGGV